MIDRQRQNAFRLPLAHREVARSVAQRSRRRLQVDRHRIVNRRLDVARRQVALQLVPPVDLNDEGVEGVELLVAARMDEGECPLSSQMQQSVGSIPCDELDLYELRRKRQTRSY